MDLQWVWKAILIVIIGTFLLRVAGRKSISQLTVSQTVLMISIGSLLIQPVGDRSIWVTFLIAALLVLTLLFVEYMEVKFDFMETAFTGKSIVIIEDGQLNIDNLKRLRLTVDKLEVRLRQKNIARVEDVQWATLEPNGQLGYILKPGKQPATKEDLQKVLQLLHQKQPYPPSNIQIVPATQEENIFTEVKKRGHPQTSRKYLD